MFVVRMKFEGLLTFVVGAVKCSFSCPSLLRVASPSSSCLICLYWQLLKSQRNANKVEQPVFWVLWRGRWWVNYILLLLLSIMLMGVPLNIQAQYVSYCEAIWARKYDPSIWWTDRSTTCSEHAARGDVTTLLMMAAVHMVFVGCTHKQASALLRAISVQL